MCGVYILPYTCMYVGRYYVFRPTCAFMLTCFRKYVCYMHIYAYVYIYMYYVYVYMYGLGI